MTQSQLTRYMEQVRGTFNVDELLRQRVDGRLIVDYYTQSDYGYRKYHSPEGAVHMALNSDGEYDQEGYYGQARIVQRHIDELRPARVLELASGKGFNTIYLAKRNPDIQFVGIDLTPPYVATARTEARELPNASFQVGDFHHLDLEQGSFGVAFSVEGVCAMPPTYSEPCLRVERFCSLVDGSSLSTRSEGTGSPIWTLRYRPPLGW